jgi:uncharacterized protein (TIGR02117 family)
MRLTRRLILWLSLPLLAVPGLYTLAAVGLGLLPAPHRAPLTGQPTVSVYLISNGWHVWLALPARQDGADWIAWLGGKDGTTAVQPGRIGDRDYVAFGWGDRDFYLNTRRPMDIRPDLAVAALLGRGPAAMHVMPIDQPDIDSHRVRRIDADPLQFHALAAYVRAGFSPGPGDQPRRLPDAGFGTNDAFYEATGRYSPFRTCNEWISAGLRAAGLATGWWTPLPFGLMRDRI